MEAKPFYMSKALWFNAVTFIVVLADYFGFSGFTVDQDLGAAYAGVVAILNVVLRLLTKTAVTLR